MEQPLVTVICLCYNQKRFVVETLQSVLNQTYQPIELIVVDDCSPDKSAEIIETFLENKPILFIKNTVNQGSTKSFNLALKHAKGTFVMDLAADDVLLPECIAQLMSGFQNSKFENLAAVASNAMYIDEDGQFLSYHFPVNEIKKVLQKRPVGDVYKDILKGGNNLFSASTLIKKSVFDQLGGYDEKLYFEDFDFWLRMSRVFTFDFVDAPLFQKRVVKNSMGSSFCNKNNPKNKIINRSYFEVLKKAYRLNKNKLEFKALTKRVHFAILLSLKNRDFSLFLQLIIFKMSVFFRPFFLKN
jgi:glycosyltransferase involved in cell wall biosynthesis